MSQLRQFGKILLSYLAGMLLGACAIGARYALDPWLGDSQSLSLLFGAVALTVWVGGAGPAIAVAVLGYIASDILFIPPRGIVAVVNASEAVALATYVVSCTAIIGFGYGMRSARRRSVEYASHLEETKSQLELAHRRKDEFLAVLAHELRNPLGPIRAAIALMIPRDPELTRARDIVDRQSKHLQRLVEDLSDLSRIREGKIALESATVSITRVLSDAVEIARPRMDSARHTLTMDLPSEPLLVQADPTRLTQVFSNLLNNATRYTPDGGEVTLRVRREADAVLVDVADNGVGIPQEMLSRIFDMYYQGNPLQDRSRGGLGIGLTLASKLVHLHNGSLEAFSAGEGKGSRFTVRLPLVAPSRSEFQPTVAVAERERHSDEMAPAVLVISRSPEFVERMAARLTGAGLKVHSAAGEAEALRVGARTRPRAVVLHIRDEVDGAHATSTVLRRSAWGIRATLVGVREHPSSSGVPARSALDQEVSDLSEAIEAVLRACSPGLPRSAAEGSAA